jgi:opacity protein-like surface antigen
MRKFLVAMGAVLLLSASAYAQSAETVATTAASEGHVETPEIEVFGGYSYLRLYGEDHNGGQVSVTGNVNNWFGITGDFAGYAARGRGEDGGFALGGPKFTYRRGPVTPFMHALFGVAFGGSDAEGAMALGGGVDARISRRVAIRIAEVDYIATTFRSNNFRFSTGIVFRFGER